MRPEPKISSSCIISNFLVNKDGKVAYEINKNNLTDFLITLYLKLEIKYPKFYKMDNLSKLGFLASEILLQDKKINERYKPEEIGIILSNASASLDSDVKYFDTLNDIASPALFVYTLPNIIIGEICIRNNIKGENTFFISSQFDIDMMVTYVRNLFMLDVLKACIFGWVECNGNNYKAALWLIEKEKSQEYFAFDIKNITNTYQQ